MLFRKLIFVLFILSIKPAAICSVIVTEVTPGGFADKAGIVVGDEITGWGYSEEETLFVPEPIGSYNDWIFCLEEYSPRGTIYITLNRESEFLVKEINNGLWGITVKPQDEDIAWTYKSAADDARDSGDPGKAHELYESAHANMKDRHYAFKALVADALAYSYMMSGDLDGMERMVNEGMKIREDNFGKSVNLAKSYYIKGLMYKTRGVLEDALENYSQAEDILSDFASDSFLMAKVINSIAVVEDELGSAERAEKLYMKALGMMERLARGSRDLGIVYNNLGTLVSNRGDLVTSEEYYLKALELFEADEPGGFNSAALYNNLAIIAADRGNSDLESSYTLKALEIFEKMAPNSLEYAMLLNNMGAIQDKRGEHRVAIEYFEQAHLIRNELAPGSLDVAMGLVNMGSSYQLLGEYEDARKCFNGSLAILEKVSPQGLFMASNLYDLGALSYSEGNPGEAVQYYLKAMEIYEKLSPNSTATAETNKVVGDFYWNSGDLEESEKYYSKAVDVLESQISMLGGSDDTRADFRSDQMDIYKGCISVLMAKGKSKDAFKQLERSRARQLLEMISQKDLVFTADIPEELEGERIELINEFASLQETMSWYSPLEDAEELEAVIIQMKALRDKQEVVRRKIIDASPKLASLRYPEPFDVSETSASLDDGTLLISYSTYYDRLYVFTFGPDKGKFKAITILAGRQELSSLVKKIRMQIGNHQMITDDSVRLSEYLLKPLKKQVKRADRIIFCPDGPLNFLPFGVLSSPLSKKRYLIEDKPISTVQSATVLAELRSHNRERKGKRFLAVGDPVYDAKRSGFERLQYSRKEIEGIADPNRCDTKILLGDDATEKKVLESSKDSRIIHFACHGIVDDNYPLNSSLALTGTSSGTENDGNLQAWEVFEHVRINADLVVLSACETALGKESDGEGLMGLTRAFQYAGAGTVLASLWSVDDESTSILMRNFYEALNSGKTKDEALRDAQIIMIEAQDTRHSHPFHWAPFQLIGDWK